MNLYIHISNENQLSSIWNDLFDTKSYEEIKKKLKIIEYKNKQISFQYLTLFETVSILKGNDYFGASIKSNVKGFYFGNDTCEHLIPTINEFKKFESFVSLINKEKNSSGKKSISFVTPDVGNYGLDRLKIIFNYLEQKKYKTEIIVNDLGVLNLINTTYTKLIPILGRMLNKAQRNPIIDKNPDPQVPSFLGKEIYEKIKKLQYAYYNSNPLSVGIYKMAFQKYNISRFGVDNITIEGNIELKNNENIDIYYPYNSVAHGRNCATRGIQEKTGEYYVQDLPCARYCNKYDIFLGQGTHERGITQRGNGIWKKYIELNKIKKELIDNKETRLIFSPFIPI